MQCLPYSIAPSLKFVQDKFHPEILTGPIPMSGGIKQGLGGENKLFSSFKRRYLETV